MKDAESRIHMWRKLGTIGKLPRSVWPTKMTLRTHPWLQEVTKNPEQHLKKSSYWHPWESCTANSVLTNNNNTPQRHSDGPQDFGENNTKGLSPHTCGTTQHVRKRTSYPQLHMVLFVLIDGTINSALCKNILLSVKLRRTTSRLTSTSEHSKETKRTFWPRFNISGGSFVLENNSVKAKRSGKGQKAHTPLSCEQQLQTVSGPTVSRGRWASCPDWLWTWTCCCAVWSQWWRWAGANGRQPPARCSDSSRQTETCRGCTVESSGSRCSGSPGPSGHSR